MQDDKIKAIATGTDHSIILRKNGEILVFGW